MNSAKLQPIIIDEKKSNGAIEYTLKAPEDLSFFPHHFPGYPIVPGVSQFQWVMNFLPNTMGVFAGINNIKFNRPITPNTTFFLSIETNTENKRASFRFYDDNGNLSSGQIIFK